MPQLPRKMSFEEAKIASVQDFRTIFHDPEVRTWLNWELIPAKNLSLGHRYLSDKPAIGNLRTPWYQNPDTSPAEWHARDAEPIHVGDVPYIPKLPGASSAGKIVKFRQFLDDTPEHTRLTLPAYKTLDGELILLDGNHRVCAVYQHVRDIDIHIVYLTGDDDPMLLPDLLHTATSDQLTNEAWQTVVTKTLALHGIFQP